MQLYRSVGAVKGEKRRHATLPLRRGGKVACPLFSPVPFSRRVVRLHRGVLPSECVASRAIALRGPNALQSLVCVPRAAQSIIPLGRKDLGYRSVAPTRPGATQAIRSWVRGERKVPQRPWQPPQLLCGCYARRLDLLCGCYAGGLLCYADTMQNRPSVRARPHNKSARLLTARTGHATLQPAAKSAPLGSTATSEGTPSNRGYVGHLSGTCARPWV
jgi:hypothetical protein